MVIESSVQGWNDSAKTRMDSSDLQYVSILHIKVLWIHKTTSPLFPYVNIYTWVCSSVINVFWELIICLHYMIYMHIPYCIHTQPTKSFTHSERLVYSKIVHYSILVCDNYELNTSYRMLPMSFFARHIWSRNYICISILVYVTQFITYYNNKRVPKRLICKNKSNKINTTHTRVSRYLDDRLTTTAYAITFPTVCHYKISCQLI